MNPLSIGHSFQLTGCHFTSRAGLSQHVGHMDTGYRDGLQAGYNDLRKHKDFHPEKHDAYEDGNHGYRKDYGDKNLYKEQYRKAFIRGYEDAFNRH